MMQTTLKSAVTFEGTGLHSGKPVRMVVRPASSEYGIWFCRTDVSGRDPLIPARWDAVHSAKLCTALSNGDGVSVSTVEHIMAAIAGIGLHNALIEIDGPEVPILDGSSAPFVAALLGRGLRTLRTPIRALQVMERVEVRNGDAVARLEPSDCLEIDFTIDFPDAAIGRQQRRFDLANGRFLYELADCRTFCREADVEAMRAQGLALGGTYDNAVVVDGDRILTPGGLRRRDEAVRHKMLDALGDLALAGGPLLGRYTSIRGGHAMTNALLRALFARPGAVRMIEVDADNAARLPGSGVSRADLAAVA
ncbi:UDP-3-O-[3-hydroxymyristoyl] N-acetylglucosamine deacetylase [Tranquillimonas rosea]|uniref:UDP-3-O-acyl-N-acetylglucosamine deacetylase n=2 Tax=Tranquillimonas rosea TaxID=641238 RepID=A0A1H9V0X0_9RHOB|nr:UDP-3-O-[3-hydroxymyristoyl] N-acetylglucosamine deacetylase [Tranquillimonas rosea]